MPEPTATPRFTLRTLPLPAKLVVTCFLMAVGLGYSSAMVQLHMQDAKSGKPMPTVADVVAKFTGKRWLSETPSRPVSKLEKLIMGPIEGTLSGTGTMAPVFFHQDAGNYRRLTSGASPQLKAKIDAEREGERLALQLWINLPADKRQRFYDSDRLIIDPAEKAPKSITSKYAGNLSKIADGIRVKTILQDRCVRCHISQGGDDLKAAQYPLETFAQLEVYMEVPAGVTLPEGGGWVKVEEPIGLEKLTQSTHAHMLSFAMLFALTGLVFAFTSFPMKIRCVFGPLALVAVTTDVSLWWLARLSDQWGPYFAMGVMGTGATVALGLGVQITFSLFNMYGKLGKVVLVGIFAGAAAGGVLLIINQIKPGLDKKEAAIQAAQQPKAEPSNPVEVKPPQKKGPEIKEKEKPPVVPSSGSSRLEELLAGKWNPELWPKPDGKVPSGSMVRAFFDKDKDFKDAWKDKDKSPEAMKAYQALVPEREGEQAVVLAWVKSTADLRKKAYEDDKFPLPAEMKDKPLTAEFFADAKAVKIKALLEARCSSCHGGESKVPLDTYEALEKFLK